MAGPHNDFSDVPLSASAAFVCFRAPVVERMFIASGSPVINSRDKVYAALTECNRTVNLSITHKSGGGDGSGFDVDQAREAFPYGHVSGRRIAGPCEVAAEPRDLDKIV